MLSLNGPSGVLRCLAQEKHAIWNPCCRGERTEIYCGTTFGTTRMGKKKKKSTNTVKKSDISKEMKQELITASEIPSTDPTKKGEPRHSKTVKKLDTPTDIFKEIKQEDLEIPKADPVKKEEPTDTLETERPSTSTSSTGPTNFEDDDVILLEHLKNTFMKLDFKLDPYDDSIIYMGRTIEPFIISDDEDDDLIYLSTTRDDDVKIKTEDDLVYVSTTRANDIKFEHEDDSLVYVSTTKAESKKESPITTTGKEITEIKENDSDVIITSKEIPNPSNDMKRKEQESDHNFINNTKKQKCQGNSTKNASTQTQSDKLGNSTTNVSTEKQKSISETAISNSRVTSTATGQTGRIENNQVHRQHIMDNDCRSHIKNKLGYYRYNQHAHLLKYASDYQLQEEFMFLYRIHDNYVRIFVKSEETDFFLKTFYDLVTCNHAFDRYRRGLLYKFNKFIRDTIQYRRWWFQYPTSMSNRNFYVFPEKVVFYGNFLITMAINNTQNKEIMIVCPVTNCAVYRAYYKFAPDFRHLREVYARLKNVITVYKRHFDQVKSAFLRQMSWQRK